MLTRSKTISIMITGILSLNQPISGQLLQEFHPKKTQCCAAVYGQRLVDSLHDWAQLGHYYEDNQRLAALPRQERRVVFLGDSITELWNLAKFFPGKPHVNRGISGQTTPQMLLRMFPDVIKLQPEAVVILAGTNDIAGNTGPTTLTMMQDNFRAITQLAEKNGIKVILCSLTPVNDYPQIKQTALHPPADIVRLNEWIRSYASEVDAGFADYYSALVDSQGMLRNGLSNDGLHPNENGYALMTPVAAAAIEKVLR